jgi:LPS-assembly lipoprotein
MSGITEHKASGHLLRLAVVLAVGMLTAACFQPLYGTQSVSPDDSVGAKFSAIEIPDIPAPKGSANARLAVDLRNALLYNFNGGGNPIAPTYQLKVNIATTTTSVTIDLTSGRPETQFEGLNASFSLIETTTQKNVLSASTFARASYDIPGSEQRFARQRAWRDAEDRAVAVVAQNIRNRLASYFVAGT